MGDQGLQDWLSREAGCSYDSGSYGNDVRRQAKKTPFNPLRTRPLLAMRSNTDSLR